MTKMRFLPLLLALALLLCACGAPAPAETTAPETTAAPTEPPEVKEVFTWENMNGIDHTEKNVNFNNIDFSQQPHFTNQLGMHDYFLSCLEGRCRNILFTCEKKAMPEIFGSDFCEKYMLAWCNPKMEPGENGIHYMISITYYPGDNVAWAYLNNDTSTLTEDELVLYDVAVNWVNENITEDMTDIEKCEAIYEYLSGNVQYSNDLLNALNTSYTFDLGITAYGAMIDNLTICQGYADAFDMLTSMLGMNCVQIFGQGNGPHNWNMIELDGNWYHVDCTWGAAFGGVDGKCSWAYFLASDARMGRTHSWARDEFPDASDESLFYYTYHDLYVTNEEELAAKVGEPLTNGAEQVDVYIKDLNLKQVKDYLESIGATFHVEENKNDLALCAWIE